MSKSMKDLLLEIIKQYPKLRSPLMPFITSKAGDYEFNKKRYREIYPTKNKASVHGVTYNISLDNLVALIENNKWLALYHHDPEAANNLAKAEYGADVIKEDQDFRFSSPKNESEKESPKEDSAKKDKEVV